MNSHIMTMFTIKKEKKMERCKFMAGNSNVSAKLNKQQELTQINFTLVRMVIMQFAPILG